MIGDLSMYLFQILHLWGSQFNTKAQQAPGIRARNNRSAIDHFPRDLVNQIQFARTNVLHIFVGEANDSHKNFPTFNEWVTNF